MESIYSHVSINNSHILRGPTSSMKRWIALQCSSFKTYSLFIYPFPGFFSGRLVLNTESNTADYLSGSVYLYPIGMMNLSTKKK